MKKSLMGLFCACLLAFALTTGARAAVVDSGHCGGSRFGNNLSWTLDDQGTLTISGTGAMEHWNEWLYNRPPWYRRRIETVVVEYGVTSIGTQAFRDCSDIKSVTIPDSVISICAGAFEGCYGLTSVTIPDSVTYIGGKAFEGCYRLTSVSIPNSVTSIGDGAFCNCWSLTSVSIPNSVTSIGDEAFCNCESLTSVSIPNSVTSIGDGALSNCNSLTSIQVATGNKNYSSKDGVLFNKAKTKLLQCPGGKQGKYTIRSSVTYIGKCAFEGCYGLTSVSIPNSVTSIGYEAFEGCYRLTSVSIPNSVTSIGDEAFYNCESLTDVYYGGTEAQWKAISIGYYNYMFTHATIHYNSGGPGLSVFDSYLQYDPVIYNDELARISAKLSLKTYEGDDSVRGCLTYDDGLDFTEANHAKFHSDNYGGSLAYTLAVRDYPGGDADRLLVIVCRGSTSAYELLKDATAQSKSAYRGCAVYDIVQDFYDAVNSGLDHVLERGKRYKVLVTGHSLGGAAANLIAASITDHGFPRFNSSCVSAYCYTFGAVNSIVSQRTVTYGYRNIHNVYNCWTPSHRFNTVCCCPRAWAAAPASSASWSRSSSKTEACRIGESLPSRRLPTRSITAWTSI